MLAHSLLRLSRTCLKVHVGSRRWRKPVRLGLNPLDLFRGTDTKMFEGITMIESWSFELHFF